MRLLRDIYAAFGEDKVLRLASSIAFAAIFALAPLLIVIIAVAGWFFGFSNGGHGHHIAENAMLDQVRRYAGPSAADTLRQLVAASFNHPRQGILAQIIGWIAFLLGAASLFSALQDSLNAIWGIEATRGGWKLMIRERAASFAMILLVMLLLIAMVGVNAGVAFIVAHAPSFIPVNAHALVTIANQVVTLVVAFLAFAAVFKVLPDVTIRWRDVWLGAFVTAVLFVVGEAAIAFYLGVAGMGSAYGAAGSLLVMLLWLYYSAAVLLLGAEFTKIAASSAATEAKTRLRVLTEQPAGVDPRRVARS